MTFQVLVSTMHQINTDLVKKMNIQSDAIIINQTDYNDTTEFKYGNKNIKFYSFNERGVGLSRNTALMRATADICLFADDDVSYVSNYEQIIIEEFQKNPTADIIVFNVPSTNKDPRQKDYIASKWKKLNYFNCFRHGTFRIAVKRDVILKNNIFFTLLFGGGAKYSAGEDSLFLADCIRKGLLVYESPTVIGKVSHSESTWFFGYTDKYFRDKGAFYACFSKHIPFLWCLQFAVRRKKLYSRDKTFHQACMLMAQGIREFKNNKE